MSSSKRGRQPDSIKRAPLAASVPRPAKRAGGRAPAAETPAFIRAVGAPVSADAKAEIRRKLGRKLGRHALDIERTSVRIEDVNGPKGGIDKRCRIKVVLSGLPSVVVEEQNESLTAAVDGALDRLQRAVRETLRRRRVEPRRSKAT
jgi:ribosome-associated translation inhibitor RaiA